MAATLIASIIITELTITSAIAIAAINAAAALVTSIIVSKIFAPSAPNLDGGGAGSNADPGISSRLRVSPEGKVGVGYGNHWVKGAEVHGEASSDYKNAYYALILSEAIATAPSTLQNVYWQEYQLTLDPTTGWVTTAVDAAGMTIPDFNNNVRVQFFSNGLPTDRSMLPQIPWFTDANNQLAGYCCAIVSIVYVRDKQIFQLADMSFNLQNNLFQPGSVLLDYLTNDRYGAGLTSAFVDSTSLAALDTYSAQLVPFTDPTTGTVTTATRYRIDGVINTNSNCWDNANEIARCAGSLIKINNGNGKFAVFIDQPSNSVFTFDSSTIFGKSTISRADLNAIPNRLVTTYSDVSTQFKGLANSFTYNAPANLVASTAPINQNQVSFGLVGNSVQAMRLSVLDMNQWQLDLSYSFNTDHRALGINAGDVIGITDSFNGWNNKLFRVASVAESEGEDGVISIEIDCKEYDPLIYTQTIVAYPIAPNSNVPSERAIANYQPAAPVLTAIDLTGAQPTFNLQLTIPSSKRVDRIEVYYSTDSTVQGNLYADIPANNAGGFFPAGVFTVLGSGLNSNALQVELNAGTYYFTTKFFNQNLASNLSGPSAALNFLPIRQQYQSQYLIIRYGTSNQGANFSTSQDNATFLGLLNSPTPTAPGTPSSYTWYPIGGVAGTANRIYFRILGNRLITFRLSTVNPGLAQWQDLYVPPNPSNPVLDLDSNTGFFVRAVYTAGGQSFLNSVSNLDGTVTFLLPPGTSVPGTTPIQNIASITVDSEGRLSGYTGVDRIFFFQASFTATGANQTFNFTHVLGQAIVFMNGLFLDLTEFSETATTITIPATYNGAIVNLVRFTMSNATGTMSFVPFTRQNINSVAGQSAYTVTGLDQGAEMLFINGVFIHDQDYSYPMANTITLAEPTPFANNVITVLTFRRFNTAQASFGQAVGNTTAGSRNVPLAGYSNVSYSLTSKNGAMLNNPGDVTTTTSAASLVVNALFTGEDVEVTAWFATGPAAVSGASGASGEAAATNTFEVLPEPVTIGQQIADLQSQINDLKQRT